jgi:hypothetical protein
MWYIIYVGCFSLGSCFTKKPDFGTPKMEKHFSWDETKIGLRGVPRHLKGHMRA